MEFFLTQLISWRVNSIAYPYILFLSWEWDEVLNYPRHIKVMKVLETCKYVSLQLIRNWLHTVKWYENTGLDLQVKSLCLFCGLNCHWDEDVIWVWFCALKLAMFLLGIFILKDVNCSSSTLFNFCGVCYSECHLSSWVLSVIYEATDCSCQPTLKSQWKWTPLKLHSSNAGFWCVHFHAPLWLHSITFILCAIL